MRKGEAVARRGGENWDGDMANGEERAQGELHVLLEREKRGAELGKVR